MEIHHTLNILFPDGQSAYTYYLEVDSALIRPGNVFTTPSDSARSYLWRYRGPMKSVNDNVNAEIHVLSVSATSVQLQIDVDDSVGTEQWQYSGKAQFADAPLPKYPHTN